MPPRKRKAEECSLCGSNSRYTCPRCQIPYCSLKCYKTHSETCSQAEQEEEPAPKPTPTITAKSAPVRELDDLKDESPLRPLTSLRWPFLPEAPSFQDPLTANDPKPLQLRHYEAIATSSRVRAALNHQDDSLRSLLKRIDTLRGSEREEALEYLLGVSPPKKQARVPDAILESANLESLEDFKRLAEAVRSAVEKSGGVQTGLDWDESTPS